MKKVTFSLATNIQTVSNEHAKEDNFYFLVWDYEGEVNNYVLEKSGNCWQFTNLRLGTTFNGTTNSFVDAINSINDAGNIGKRDLYEFESLSKLINFLRNKKKN